jgi:uncharacterized protein (TIGR03545 family)
MNDEKKTAKPPKPFRKPLPAKRYRRKLAGRIYLEPDRRFLESITTTDADGRIVLSRELTREERGRLKKLRKDAKKNARGPRLMRLAILGIVVGAVVVFNLVFKDRLVTRGAESLLENVFEAQVDISGLTFRPFGGEISFDSMEIADAEAPMTNLMELSRGALRIDTWQLLGGHVLIEEITVDGLQFSTPRQISGALPASEQATEQSVGSGEPGQPTLADRAADAVGAISFADLGLPDTLDGQEFLQQNLDALATTAAVQTIATTAEGFVDRWTGELNSLESEATEIARDVQRLAGTDFTAIRSVDEAMSMIEDATALHAAATGIVTRVEADYDALVAEADAIITASRALPGLIGEDYNELLARVPELGGEGRDFIVGLVQPFLRGALGDWYGKATRGLDIYHRFTALAQERTPRRAARRTGIDVDFSTVAYPRLLLSQGALGVGASGDETLLAEVMNVSTDPDLTDAPTDIHYQQTGAQRRLEVDASLDGRTDATEPMDLAIAVTGSPLDISSGLDVLELNNVTGLLDIEAELRRGADDSLTGTVRLIATDVRASGSYGPGSLGEFVADLLNDAGRLTGVFGFVAPEGGSMRFTDGSTNLDDLVAQAVRERIDAALATFREELRQRLTGYLDPIIASVSDEISDVVGVQTSAEELLELARDREAAAAELQRLASNTVDQLRSRLEAEAQRALDAARAEAEAAAEAARQAAEEAAREAAEEAAENAADRIRNLLPGRR